MTDCTHLLQQSDVRAKLRLRTRTTFSQPLMVTIGIVEVWLHQFDGRRHRNKGRSYGDEMGDRSRVYCLGI